MASVLSRRAGIGVLMAAGVLAAASGAALERERAVKQLDAKLAPVVRGVAADAAPRGFILQLRETATDADLAALRIAGARHTRRYASLPMVAVVAPGTSVRRLAALPFVTRLSPDLQVRRTLDVAGPAVGADVARNNFRLTGEGVGIALIDSGITTSNDLSNSYADARSRVVGGYDFITRTPNYKKNDECGHGSCVAGILGGNAYNSSGLLSKKRFFGIAPEAHLLNLRVLDAYGNGTVSDAIAALDWCIRNRGAYNIRVVNMSLGHPPGESYRTDPLCQAAERAQQAGMLVVCAAGNRGRKNVEDANSGVAYGTINSPGNDPYVLTIGATNDLNTLSRGDDTVATYSSRGPSRLDFILKPDLVAPGNRIVSIRNRDGVLDRVIAPLNVVSPLYYVTGALGLGQLGLGQSDYFEFSGTSMAAPMASGAAALLFQKDPSLSPDDVKARLMLSARKQWRNDNTTPDIFSRGAGYLDIPAALRSQSRVTSPAISPYCSLEGEQVVIHADQAVWGGEAIQSDQAIWGDAPSVGSPTFNSQAIWGDQSVWGDQTIQSDQAIWGDAPAVGSPTFNSQAIWGDISRIAVDGDKP